MDNENLTDKEIEQELEEIKLDELTEEEEKGVEGGGGSVKGDFFTRGNSTFFIDIGIKPKYGKDSVSIDVIGAGPSYGYRPMGYSIKGKGWFWRFRPGSNEKVIEIAIHNAKSASYLAKGQVITAHPGGTSGFLPIRARLHCR